MKMLFLALLGAISMGLSAQQYLYIQQNNDVPYKRFALKDEVKFKLSESENWVEGMLTEVNQKSIKVNGRIYPLEKITAFRSYNGLLQFTGKAMATAGVFFTGIIFVNRLINSDRPLLRDGQIIFGAAMLGGGFLVKWLSRKTYEKDEGWHWNVIDLEKDMEEDAK